MITVLFSGFVTFVPSQARVTIPCRAVYSTSGSDQKCLSSAPTHGRFRPESRRARQCWRSWIVSRPGLRRPHTYKSSRDWARNEQERGDTRRRVFRAFFTCDATWCHYICKLL
ncbi:hypothetical protein R3P38DRAFT_2907712 [Favolaschia claudopus]|uniref:Secreted protein n=1 Tax=Favolaschia claudopus TaxID=2862362 RepID=A0AAW0CFW4_9AGAR